MIFFALLSFLPIVMIIFSLILSSALMFMNFILFIPFHLSFLLHGKILQCVIPLPRFDSGTLFMTHINRNYKWNEYESERESSHPEVTLLGFFLLIIIFFLKFPSFPLFSPGLWLTMYKEDAPSYLEIWLIQELRGRIARHSFNQRKRRERSDKKSHKEKKMQRGCFLDWNPQNR